ncbi:MAG: hypothetical protein WC518_01110 [Patescibacteria group bacterium]
MNGIELSMRDRHALVLFLIVEVVLCGWAGSRLFPLAPPDPQYEWKVEILNYYFQDNAVYPEQAWWLRTKQAKVLPIARKIRPDDNSYWWGKFHYQTPSRLWDKLYYQARITMDDRRIKLSGHPTRKGLPQELSSLQASIDVLAKYFAREPLSPGDAWWLRNKESFVLKILAIGFDGPPQELLTALNSYTIKLPPAT